jgi:hypothetical protein
MAESNDYSILSEVNEEEFADEEVTTKGTEVGCVGAQIGGGFDNTNELKVMKFDEAMRIDNKPQWEQAIKEEYERFDKNKVFKKVKR